MQFATHHWRRPCRAALFCLLGMAGTAAAAPPGWHAVDASELVRLRGGFTTAAGLEISLGIERLVNINGQLVSRTSFQLADVRGLNAQQVRETSTALAAVKLIQNGSENMNQAVFSSDTLGGTVIQNTLSNQQIESRTVINASVNSLGILKSMNFNGSVGDAIARSAGNR